MRVLLVEPMALLRGALAQVLGAERDLGVVAEVGRYADVTSTGALHPEVAVVGLDPPSAEGLAAVAWLTEQLSGCAVLVVTSGAGAERTWQAMRGAALDRKVSGIIGTDNTPAQLVRYIRRAASGARVLDPALRAARGVRRNPLTRREREIIRLAAVGMPDREIATKLGLSTGTVRNYLSGIIGKTGARNRVEAVHLARRAGWI
jgi:two-component system, NarL family, response regulator DesR